MSELKLTNFKALVFDVYATLIVSRAYHCRCVLFANTEARQDWESGIYEALQPLVKRISSPVGTSKTELLLAFTSVESDLQAKYPTMLYADILAHIHAELAARLTNQSSHASAQVTATAVTSRSTAAGTETDVTTAGSSGAPEQGDIPSSEGLSDEDIAFGKSIPTWPPFPDTIAALTALSKHYKLTVLSNVDRRSFSGTREVLERSDPAHHFTFDAVYTAQDIGSYKPNPANLNYALKRLREDFGIEKDQVLVVAASLFHDHAPANRLGLKSVYIDREGAVIGSSGQADYNWKFTTLGAMAEAVESEGARL